MPFNIVTDPLSDQILENHQKIVTDGVNLNQFNFRKNIKMTATLTTHQEQIISV